MSEWLGFIHQLHFANQNLGAGRNVDARHFSDFHRWLSNDSGVERAVFQNDILYRLQFSALQQIAAVAGETFAYCVIH